MNEQQQILTGERLAKMETMLEVIGEDIKKLESNDIRILEAIAQKADASEIRTLHDRIDKVKLTVGDQIKDLESAVGEHTKDLENLQATRKSDMRWFAAIAGGVSFIISVSAIIVAAIIQRGG